MAAFFVPKNRMKRIQRKREKGWRMPVNTVYVGRPTKWGNPFIGREAADRYRRWLWYSKSERARFLWGKFSELEGKNLACWCPPDKPCHVDVLLQTFELIKKGRLLRL